VEREETLQNYRAGRAFVIDNVDVARAWVSGLHDFTALEPADKVRFLLVADSLFGNIQSFFLHHRDGRMPRKLYEPQREVSGRLPRLPRCPGSLGSPQELLPCRVSSVGGREHRGRSR